MWELDITEFVTFSNGDWSTLTGRCKPTLYIKFGNPTPYEVLRVAEDGQSLFFNTTEKVKQVYNVYEN